MACKKHRELAAFIKGVHQTLRIQSRIVGAEEAWYQHCQQTHTLEKYAESMQCLAKEFWEKNNCEDSALCRIQWVVSHSMEYFYGGGSERAETKELNMSLRYFDRPLEQIQCLEKTGSKLELLDVGSCYNPFAKFSVFNVTALDLMPASADVLKCDFLSIDISNEIDSIKNPNILPEKYFDIIVFSLLLEYFPSSEQRLQCCKNAFKLLKPGALLFILTPDSKHASANSKVMKSWRYALAAIGFWRVNYQKLKHLHCMSYRRCVNVEVPRHWLGLQNSQERPGNLFIPQDFHEYDGNSSDDDTTMERCETDNKLIADSFADLPDSDLFS